MRFLVLAALLATTPALAFDGFLADQVGGRGSPPLNLSNPLPGTYSNTGVNACFSHGITVPPPQFDHPARNEQIIRVPCAQVAAVCRNGEANACAILPAKAGQPCKIIIPIEMTLDWEYGYTLRHERGHCNSGSVDHAGYVLPPGL